MNEKTRNTDPLDGLVRRYLRSEQERVDVEAFLRRLKARRGVRRWITPLPTTLAAAAVLLLGATAALVLWRAAPTSAPAEEASAEAPLLEDYSEAARAELRAALEGARGVGWATVSAGRVPLEELSRTRPRMADLTASAEAALRRLMPLDETHQPHEENGL